MKHTMSCVCMMMYDIVHVPLHVYSMQRICEFKKAGELDRLVQGCKHTSKPLQDACLRNMVWQTEANSS